MLDLSESEYAFAGSRLEEELDGLELLGELEDELEGLELEGLELDGVELAGLPEEELLDELERDELDELELDELDELELLDELDELELLEEEELDDSGASEEHPANRNVIANNANMLLPFMLPYLLLCI